MNRKRYEKWIKYNKYKRIWRSILYSALKRMNIEKSGKTIDLLGYSADELKKRIESQWVPEMSWDNYGEWHIDHIIPIAIFSKDADIKIVNGLNNLRPMWATTRVIGGVLYEGNLNKGANVS